MAPNDSGVDHNSDVSKVENNLNMGDNNSSKVIICPLLFKNMVSVALSQIQVKRSYCTENLTFQQLTELHHLSLSSSTSFPHWDSNQQKFDAFPDICYQKDQGQI